VRSIQIAPTAQAYLELARTLRQNQRNADALVAYQLALKLNPDIPEAEQAVTELRQLNP
jgi:cytochrome c-type biogenesis protein CcmH/NrfG